MNKGGQRDKTYQKDQSYSKDPSQNLQIKKGNTFNPNTSHKEHYSKDLNNNLQVKKGNTFNPKTAASAEEKEKSSQDYQPQWKMGIPKRGSYEEPAEYDDYYNSILYGRVF